jgi:putative endonuclease
MPNLRRIGATAEDKAADYLLGLGYTIVTRRFKSSRGEIDIVALDGEVLVFVEVKMRNNLKYAPEEQVTASKVRYFCAAVEDYLQKAEMQKATCRFDIVAVTSNELRHHKDAFRAVR